MIVTAEDLKYYYYNIKNAFTESEMKKDIYITLLLNITVKKEKILKILYSLYNLKQSACDWNLLLKLIIIEWGFKQSYADLYLFTHIIREIIVLVYIDNISVAAQINKDFI